MSATLFKMDKIEEALIELPDVVAKSLEKWRMKTLEREKIEALLYLQFKGQDMKYTADEVKSMVRSSDSRYQAVLEEIKAESDYNLVYERLMSAKKRASLRTAF